jgi:hypothetical protein
MGTKMVMHIIKAQVDAGIKPQKTPVGIMEADREFANKKFAVMIKDLECLVRGLT